VAVAFQNWGVHRQPQSILGTGPSARKRAEKGEASTQDTTSGLGDRQLTTQKSNTERSQRQKTNTNLKQEEREVAEVRDLKALAWNEVRLSSASSEDSCSNLPSLCGLCGLSIVCESTG
jgi:hypothetical protein